jgi:two-component system sensor histidine kinase FlrB
MTATAATTPQTPAAQRIEELGRIILAYSEVTERLEQSHDELKARVQALQDELSEKNRQLERSNRLAALGEMAAGLAHEIRNPLGGIQLYASMLAEDVADRPDSARTVGKIIGGVKRVEELVSQVLRFTREIIATPAPCDLAQIVRDTVELAQMQIASKSAGAKDSTMHAADVACFIPQQLQYNVDARLLSQALLNLILNAHEAITENGGSTIRVKLDAHENRAKLVVEDDGPGIPAHVLDRIFNPFFTTKDEGTGLGLSIVHRIVEAHNGTITASNRQEGGARFEIRI